MNPEKEWKRISPHNHTAAYSGCSEISPLNLIAGSAQAGLHGLIVTEHNHLWDSEELSQLKQRAVREKLCPPDFLLFAGREVTATAGGKTAHALVFGYNGNIPVGMDLTALCNYVHDRNGVIVLAHPCRNSGKKNY